MIGADVVDGKVPTEILLARWHLWGNRSVVSFFFGVVAKTEQNLQRLQR